MALWSTLPNGSGKKAATTGANKKKPVSGGDTSWGAKIKSALGIIPDQTNVAAHPGTKFKYKNPNPLTSTDKRSTLQMLGDELRGKTVGGNEIREIESVSAAAPKKPKGPKPFVPVKTAVAKPRARAAVSTAVAAAPAQRYSGFENERMKSAAYTTSAPNRNWSGYTGGSASSSSAVARHVKPKAAKAYQSNLKHQGAKHDTGGLKWFNAKKS